MIRNLKIETGIPEVDLFGFEMIIIKVLGFVIDLQDKLGPLVTTVIHTSRVRLIPCKRYIT